MSTEELLQDYCILIHLCYLCLCNGTSSFVFLREEKADGHEELVDADSELLLILASCGQREEPAGLDNVLEDVLAGLENRKSNHLLGDENGNKSHFNSSEGG